MFDLIRTLDPANGLTKAWRMRPPAKGSPLWSVAVDLGAGPFAVGAAGADRAETLARAAGEAVERFALIPATPRETYPGRRLDTGEDVPVPAGLVDYPAPDSGHDASPSGAAAGPDLDFAIRGALLELVERHAVLTAWLNRTPPARHDLAEELAHAPATRDWRLLGRLPWEAVRVYRVPVLPGLHCALAAVVDERGFVACGVKAHEDLGRTLLVAVQEALQVRDLLAALDGHEPPEAVRDELDRARLWRTPAAVREFRERYDHAATVPAGAPSRAPHSVAELVAAVVADGGWPVLVDLTERLPAAHRDMGWRAVKVLVAGYRALPIDETRAGIPGCFPHPLI